MSDPLPAAAALYEPSAAFAAAAHVDAAGYRANYAASLADPDDFWREQARRIDWIKPFTRVKNTDFTYGQVSIKWFEDGTLNVAANCIDRTLPPAPGRPRSSGNPTIPGPRPATSPTAICMIRPAAWPTC